MEDFQRFPDNWGNFACFLIFSGLIDKEGIQRPGKSEPGFVEGVKNTSFRS
jgi:hypothetical protein